jgi:lysyl-tRNA synthetase class 2
MALTEGMFNAVALEVMGREELPFGENPDGTPRIISYKLPFPRYTLKEAIVHFAGVHVERLQDPSELAKMARDASIEHVDKKSPGILLGELFEALAEPHLVQPTFITDYPIELSPLTKTLPGNDTFVDRFELFVGGMELANAYSELNDPVDQLGRFQAQAAMRDEGFDEAMHMDMDFVNALEHGFPPCGGLGVGIDRMVMLMTNSHSIRDVILFPLMRPRSGEASEATPSQEQAT